MKKLLTPLIVLASVAMVFAAPDKDILLTKEKTAWQAFKDKKPDDFKMSPLMSSASTPRALTVCKANSTI